jgi:hypothetical protein
MIRRSIAVALAACSAALMVAVVAPAAWGETPVEGAVTNDTTWTKAGGPYVLSDDVTVTKDSTLTIEAGTVVRGAPGAHLYVAGALRAIGTAEDPIIFRRHTTSGNWGGIVLIGELTQPSDTTTTIREAIVEFAEVGVHSRYDAPTIDNTLFANNDTAFKIVSPQDRAMTIADNVFANNGTALTGQAGNTVNVLRNDFWNNAINIIAGPKPVYDCPDPAAAWEIHDNDILRGPQNSTFWSYDVRATADFTVDATDNWWGTNNESKIIGRIQPQTACCPAPADLGPIDISPISQSPNTAWVPTEATPDPPAGAPMHGDPGYIVSIGSPDDGSCHSRTSFSRISGTASKGIGLGPVDKVRIAVRLERSGGRCAWWSRKQRQFVPGYCSTPRWFRPTGVEEWRYTFPYALPAGRYTAFAVASGSDGGNSRTESVRFRLLESGGAVNP